MKLAYRRRKDKSCAKCKKPYLGDAELLWTDNKAMETFHFECFTPKKCHLTSAFHDHISSLKLRDQIRVYEQLENFDDKIDQIQEFIDVEEAECKEKNEKDEDYENEALDSENEEIEDEDEGDYESEEVEGPSGTIYVGRKRNISSTSAPSSSTSKRSKPLKENNYSPREIANKYNRLTVAELKKICKERKLSSLGSKDDLVQRCTSKAKARQHPQKKTTVHDKWSNGCFLV